MKTKKRSSLKFSPVFGPKLRKGQKKVFAHSFCAQTLCPSYKGGRGMPQFCILFYANYTILATQRGGHGQMPPLNTPLLRCLTTSIGTDMKYHVVLLLLTAEQQICSPRYYKWKTQKASACICYCIFSSFQCFQLCLSNCCHRRWVPGRVGDID